MPYKVEYLVIIDTEEFNCGNIKSLKNLLQTNADLTIEGKKINNKSFATEFEIQEGSIQNSTHVYFSLKFSCDKEEDFSNFTESLRVIKSAMFLVTKNFYTIWDDLSLYYSEKAYTEIHKIENSMRKLIAKFMLTKIGIGWTKDRVPTDVENAIRPTNKDQNYLNNIDFIQLKEVLFSDNFPKDKENLIKKLKSAKDLTNINITEIQSLIPISNWDKYFKSIVNCDADYLKSRWDRLYDLRCKIAHNKPFNKTDLEETRKLIGETEGYIQKAIEGLEDINIDEEERENLAENVVVNLHSIYGEFISYWRELEVLMHEIVADNEADFENIKVKPPIMLITKLYQLKIINDDQLKKLAALNKIRNAIVHSTETATNMEDLKNSITLIKLAITFLHEKKPKK